MDAGEQDTSASNLQYVEYLYERFLEDPGSVGEEWRKFFERNFSSGDAPPPGADLFPRASIFHKGDGTRRDGHEETAALQDRLDQFVRAYRVRGHMIARLDPLGRPRRHFRELDPDFYGLTGEMMDRTFSSRTGVAGSGISSASSRNAKMRSDAAAVDCITVAMFAVWVMGWVNWLRYWMKA